MWPKYLVGASELLVTVFSIDDDVTDFWFLNFRLFIPERQENNRLQMDSIQLSTAVIYGLILQQFLVACTRLYKSLCLSVGRLVGWSVGLSHFTFFAFWSSKRVDKCRLKYFMSVRQQFGTFFFIFCLRLIKY